MMPKMSAFCKMPFSRLHAKLSETSLHSRFFRQPRRDEGAYPLRSLPEEQRWLTAKKLKDCIMVFLLGDLGNQRENRCGIDTKH